MPLEDKLEKLADGSYVGNILPIKKLARFHSLDPKSLHIQLKGDKGYGTLMKAGELFGLVVMACDLLRGSSLWPGNPTPHASSAPSTCIGWWPRCFPAQLGLKASVQQKMLGSAAVL